jgi:cytochrome P450
MDDQNDPVKMVLGHKDVRKCAFDWKKFQSGAVPGRIVVPSEVNIRDIRQIPFEVDPPEHTAYRSLLESWFKRPLAADYEQRLEVLVETMLSDIATKTSFDVISDFSLPLQSKALTFLLNTPIEEATTWISWGTHVFRSDETSLDSSKATVLFDYLDQKIDQAELNPKDDLYAVLLNAEFEGRKLTKEEVKGIMILTFAGGRDTIINTVTNTFAYFAENPKKLHLLAENPTNIPLAVEELIRYFSPLTQMGRVVTEDTEVCSHAVKKDTRISLCWASANRDEKVFENPNTVQLDRKNNPHVAFGFSHHKCLGATHTRQLMKILLKNMAAKKIKINILNAKEKMEALGDTQRKVGFESLVVSISK